MRRQWLKRFALAVVVITAVGSRAHAQGGRPSGDVLSAMGLGGMTVMSDDDAMSIRGHGYKQSSSVAVFGNSFATVDSTYGTAHSENGYAADGKHFAAGGNYSEAGIVIKTTKGGKGGGKKWGSSNKRWGGSGNMGGGGYPGGNMGGGGYPGGNMGGGGYPGGNMGGGGHPGGTTTVKTVKVFAGGFSFGVAH